MTEDIWWPQCCYLDNNRLNINNLNESRCPNPARWEIKGPTESMTHSCDIHLPILLEEAGDNIVTNLFDGVKDESR
jgi:hypothetical protein